VAFCACDYVSHRLMMYLETDMKHLESTKYVDFWMLASPVGGEGFWLPRHLLSLGCLRHVCCKCASSESTNFAIPSLKNVF
jgi:hypothetical protein